MKSLENILDNSEKESYETRLEIHQKAYIDSELVDAYYIFMGLYYSIKAYFTDRLRLNKNKTIGMGF